jgi:hypothetical protein
METCKIRKALENNDIIDKKIKLKPIKNFKEEIDDIKLIATNDKQTKIYNITIISDPKVASKKKLKRKTIPKTIKNKVWDKYIGAEYGIGECYVCESDIDSKHFVC